MLAETSMNALSAGIGAGVAVAVTIVAKTVPFLKAGNGRKSSSCSVELRREHETRISVTEMTLKAIQREIDAGFKRIEKRLDTMETLIRR